MNRINTGRLTVGFPLHWYRVTTLKKAASVLTQSPIERRPAQLTPALNALWSVKSAPIKDHAGHLSFQLAKQTLATDTSEENMSPMPKWPAINQPDWYCVTFQATKWKSKIMLAGIWSNFRLHVCGLFAEWRVLQVGTAAVAMTKPCFGVSLKTYGTNQLRVSKRSRRGNSHARVPEEARRRPTASVGTALVNVASPPLARSPRPIASQAGCVQQDCASKRQRSRF